MKPYFKSPLHLTIFFTEITLIFVAIGTFVQGVIAYCMGYHHGFKEPWPQIQSALYISFFTILVAFCVYILVVAIIQPETTNEKVENKQ